MAKQEQRQEQSKDERPDPDDREAVARKQTAERKSQGAYRREVKGGGSDLDAEIAELDARVTSLEARVTALEEADGGDGTDPAPEPPDPEPPSDKRYPERSDGTAGLPEGTSLTTQGGMTISQNGTKISGKKFTGRVTVTASDVEISNCLFECSDWWAIDAARSTRLVVHHCDFVSSSTMGNSAVNTGTATHVHHCWSKGFENALNIAGRDNIIEWNDFAELKGNSDSHYDVMQADGNNSGLIVRNNRFDCGNYGQTAASMIDNYFGAQDNILVENNLLMGGGYTCYLDASFGGSAKATNIRYLNNVIKPGSWGSFYWKQPGTGCRHEGNVHYQTGASVD